MLTCTAYDLLLLIGILKFMKKFFLLLLLSVTLAACSDKSPVVPATNPPAPAVSSDDAIAIVNGQPIPRAYLQAVLNEMKRGMPQAAQFNDDQINQVKDNLVTLEVLSQEAIKEGLDKTSDFSYQLEIMRRGMLMGLLQQKYMQDHPVTDETVAAEYEHMKALVGTQYLARHILVTSEDQAKDILQQLQQGAKFSELAKQYSIDKGTADKGGLLDWAAANAYVPEFAQALENMKKGETTTTPVKTDYGWHIIMLEDIRHADLSDFPPLDIVKEQLRAQLTEKAFMDYQRKLLDSAKVELLPEPAQQAQQPVTDNVPPSAPAQDPGSDAAKVQSEVPAATSAPAATSQTAEPPEVK